MFKPIFDKIPWAIIIAHGILPKMAMLQICELNIPFERAPVKLSENRIFATQVMAVQRCYASHNVSADIPLICLSLLYTARQSDSDGDQCGTPVPNTSP